MRGLNLGHQPPLPAPLLPWGKSGQKPSPHSTAFARFHFAVCVAFRRERFSRRMSRRISTRRTNFTPKANSARRPPFTKRFCNPARFRRRFGSITATRNSNWDNRAAPSPPIGGRNCWRRATLKCGQTWSSCAIRSPARRCAKAAGKIGSAPCRSTNGRCWRPSLSG